MYNSCRLGLFFDLNQVLFLCWVIASVHAILAAFIFDHGGSEAPWSSGEWVIGEGRGAAGERARRKERRCAVAQITYHTMLQYALLRMHECCTVSCLCARLGRRDS